MDGLTDALNSAFEGETSDPGDATAGTTETEVQDAAPQSVEPGATATTHDDNEPLFNREQFLKEHPDLEPWAKQMQADYTRKTQELAEQRKQFEGLDEGTVAAIRYVNDLAATNPKAAADWLAQQAEALRGPAQPDPYAEMEFATETERVLAEKLRHVEQQVNQQQIAHFNTELDRQFAALETDHGEISNAERAGVAQWMADRGMGIRDLPLAWKALNFDRLVNSAARKARDEASSVVQRKAGMAAPPSGVASRETGVPAEPRTLREALEGAIPK